MFRSRDKALEITYHRVPATAGSTPAGRGMYGRPVLLALNGGPESAAAARVALSLAEARHAEPVVLRAYYPGPAWIPLPPSTGPGPSAPAAARSGVRAQVLQAGSEAARWPIVIVAGAPSAVIIETARELGAAAILMGLHKRHPLQRALGAETSLQVMRHAHVPVLATTATMRGLPVRICVGVDFAGASLRAAKAAMEMLADGGTLDLVFVDGPERRSQASAADYERHRRRVVAAFNRLCEDIAPPPDITLTTTMLEGIPSVELLAFAGRVGAEVIAVASRQLGMMEQLLLGSVTAALVHDGGFSLLVVPPQ